MIAVIVLIVAILAFWSGFAVGRLPSRPTLYTPHVGLARATVIESIRDRRADISAALRGRA